MKINSISTIMIRPPIKKNSNIITQKDKKIEKINSSSNNMKKEKHSSLINEKN